MRELKDDVKVALDVALQLEDKDSGANCQSTYETRECERKESDSPVLPTNNAYDGFYCIPCPKSKASQGTLTATLQTSRDLDPIELRPLRGTTPTQVLASNHIELYENGFGDWLKLWWN
jgi:hypothetical protein